MRNVKNLTLCVLLLALASTAAVADSPIKVLAQYDCENVIPNQGVSVPAPASFVNTALVTASDLRIVQGSGVTLLNTPGRDGVINNGITQLMSFQQGIPAYSVIQPQYYNYFEFSVAAVDATVGITSISFMAGQNYAVHTPPGPALVGIIEYYSFGGAPLGSNTFVIPYGLTGTPVSIGLSTTLVVGDEPVFFRIRFNELVYGRHSWTTQIHLDDVELCGGLYGVVETQELIDKVVALELPAGIENSLVSRLQNAIDLFQKGRENPAMNMLGAFINEVEAQRGKEIPEADADALIALAQAIIEVLETE